MSIMVDSVSNSMDNYYASRLAANNYNGLSNDSIFSNSGYSTYSYGCNYEALQANRTQRQLYSNTIKSEELLRANNYKNIQASLMDGCEDEASEVIDKAIADMKTNTAYEGLSDEELMQILQSEYSQITGVELSADIKKYASGNISTAFKKKALWGNADSTTQGQLLEKVTGRKNRESGFASFMGCLAGYVGAILGWIPLAFGARG